jgi:beta-glucosidase
MRLLFVALIGLFLLSMAGFHSRPVRLTSIDPTYKNKALPIEQRAQNLLAQMTLDEKVAQVLSLWADARRMMDKKTGRFLPDSARLCMPHGIGQITRPKEPYKGVGNFPSRTTRQTVEYCNAIQRWLADSTRLGIPAVMHEESLHGYVARGATAFPQAIALASTWNPALIERAFDVAAREARACGNHLVLAPVVDVTRDPRWGRTEETYGEDTYLAGEIGLAAVRGFQGRTGIIDGDHVMATLKHMTGHGQPESGNNIAPAPVPKRHVLEFFLPPFQKCIKEGYAKCVMPSYNEIDGVPSHNSQWLLRDILRKEWGFQGVVVSDYFAINEMKDRHLIARDYKETAIKAMRAGVDVETPNPKCYPLLKAAIDSNEISVALLDSAVVRILRQKFALGLFENPYADAEKAEKIVGARENVPLALQAAEEAIVLLKNKDNIAPLSTEKYKHIAVIGPNANRTLLGGYSDQPRYFVTVLDGIKRKVGDRAKVSYAEGCGITTPCSWYKDPVKRTSVEQDRQKIQEAVALAQTADVVVLAIGGNECESREAWADTHLGDQPSMNLVGLQEELFAALHATGKPVVVLLLNGRPYSIPNIAAKASALFECWYLGQECGRAVANVLFGSTNPSGKLPITFPRSAGHLPVFYNHKPSARRGYQFGDATPLFAFGYGLSYTKFALDTPRLSKTVIGPDESVEVRVKVTNKGRRRGSEVVQCYIRDEYASVTRPVKELKDFAKVSLAPGESTTVTFRITPEKLSMYDYEMRWVVEPGTFQIMTGGSSLDKDLKKTVLTVSKVDRF